MKNVSFSLSAFAAMVYTLSVGISGAIASSKVGVRIEAEIGQYDWFDHTNEVQLVVALVPKEACVTCSGKHFLFGTRDLPRGSKKVVYNAIVKNGDKLQFGKIFSEDSALIDRLNNYNVYVDLIEKDLTVPPVGAPLEAMYIASFGDKYNQLFENEFEVESGEYTFLLPKKGNIRISIHSF